MFNRAAEKTGLQENNLGLWSSPSMAAGRQNGVVMSDNDGDEGTVPGWRLCCYSYMGEALKVSHCQQK